MNLIQSIAQNDRVQDALRSFENDLNTAIETAISIQRIPSPTFSEATKAAFLERRFSEIGLLDVQQDSIHNVYGRIAGAETRPPVVISAHIDTVFPEDTDLSIRFNNGLGPTEGLIFGPGLADNSTGVAGLLLLAQAIERFDLQSAADIWLVANACEEGLGDLQGMRAVVGRFGSEATYLVLEGGSFGHVFYEAIGVKRFRIEVETAGGHSWGDFGSPSAVHVLGQLISAITQLKVKSQAKTTYNVGMISGGTTVNTIAAEANCLLDLRSTNQAALKKLVKSVRDLVAAAGRQTGVKSRFIQIGDRPAGRLSRHEPLVEWATDALHYVGCEKVRYMAGSTDANVPISMGLPAVCIGLANSGNTHRVDEFLDPKHLAQGLSQLLLLTLAAAGFES